MARKSDASEGMRNPSDGASPPAARRLTLVQLASALDRDRNTVKGWLDKGCPAVVRANRATGQTWVLDLADVVKWLEQRASETAAGVAAGIDDEDLISREEADRRTAVIRSKKEAISLDEPWDALEGKTVKPEGLAARSKPFASECPDGVVVATCGIDVQSGSEDQEKVDAKPPRLEAQIVGHGRGGESWVLGYWVLDRHEPFTAESRTELDALLQRRFRKADGSEVPVTATAIDTGGGYGDAVKSYAASRTAWNVWAVKGRNNRLGTRSASVWPARVSRAKGSVAGFAHRMIDTQLAKDVIGRRLKIESAGPGFVHFPMSLPDSYFQSLAAEKLVIDKRGNRFWRIRGLEEGLATGAATVTSQVAGSVAYVPRGEAMKTLAILYDRLAEIDGGRASPRVRHIRVIPHRGY